MNKEKEYYKKAKKETVKKYGQFFTPDLIADFMAKWVSNNAKSCLDPAVGNGIFYQKITKYKNKINFKGYEIDKNIIDFFGVNNNVEISDYLLSDWDSKYDAIICNPPYNRFQSIDNRDVIFDTIKNKTKINISGYTNQALLFLIKSIFQLTDSGRLAYIIPTDFLDSKYGNEIKKYLIDKELLYSIINFDTNVFDSATTTSCILLIDKTAKNGIYFKNITDITDLEKISFNEDDFIEYKSLICSDKWLKYLLNGNDSFNNCCKFKKYASVSRGIATGCNDFFIFDIEKIKEYNLKMDYFDLCITKSLYVNDYVFKDEDIEKIKNTKKIFLLNISSDNNDPNLKRYINLGLEQKVNEKYLLTTRNPWFSMENKSVAPIWITNASRNGIKIIRNTTSAKNLTTFHSCFINDEYKKYLNIFFCYLITDIGQHLLQKNKKTMGGGLDKYQPSDLNNAYVFDFELLTADDFNKLNELADEFIKTEDISIISIMNSIFSNYVTI